MDQTYNKTFNANQTYNQSPSPRKNPNQTYDKSPRTVNPDRTYNKPPMVNRTYKRNATYDKTPNRTYNMHSSPRNRTYNKSSGRDNNRTYDQNEYSDESSSVCFVQEEDYTPESSEPSFEPSYAEFRLNEPNWNVNYSKMGRPLLQSTPRHNFDVNLNDLSHEIDQLDPLLGRLENKLRNRYNRTKSPFGRTFLASPEEKFYTPPDRTWGIYVDHQDKSNQRTRSKSVPRRKFMEPTPTPQYYKNSPIRSSPNTYTSDRINQKVAKKLNFSNHFDNTMNFSNRLSVTKTDPNWTFNYIY